MAEGYYKINPEIRDFIVKEAGERPELGCRKLAHLIQEKFGLEVSKSSISAILKAEGLNKPIGRRASGEKHIPLKPETLAQHPESGLSLLAVKEKQLLTKIEREVSLAPRIIQNDTLPPALQEECRQIVNKTTDDRARDTQKDSPGAVPGLGCWFLKAGELCLGGLRAFSALLSSSLKEEAGELLAKNEALLYLPVLGEEEIINTDGFRAEALAALTGRRYSNKDVQAYLESLKQAGPLNLGIFAQEGLGQKEVLGLKFILEDGACFFLDGSMRSIWSKNHIPLEFSQGLSTVREYLARAIIQDNSPLIGQASPGFESPASAFLNFAASFSGKSAAKAVKRIEFYDDEDKLIEALEPIPLKRHYFILGIWPWQYPDRSILKKEGLRLIGYNKGGREVLTIITNLSEEQKDDERIINLYLKRWPNLEAGYQDFLDKIGHYFEIEKAFLLSDKSQIEIPKGRDLDINQILGFWRIRLNSFFRRHFLPLKYATTDFTRLKEHFYSLSGNIKSEEESMEVIFCRPQEASHYEDLAYACQRVNEADIRLGDERQLMFKIT